MDLVILNFVPVPAEVEPDMADQNVEAILQADPQPPPLVPDPGAQNIEGGRAFPHTLSWTQIFLGST